MLIRGEEYKNKSIQSFSLVELLITIAILAIMAGAIVVVISPGELLAQARDSNRMAELNSLNKVITMHSNSVGGFRGAPDIVYISIPSNLANCSDLSLPALPAGWSYRCVTAANLRRVDGLGWIPINFNAMPGGSPFNQLPIDPVNSATNTLYFAYTRGSGGYAAVALLESARHGRSALQDGGSDAGRYEVGTDLSLWSRASGLVGYWSFTGVGAITNNQTIGMEDASGNNNHGRASNTNAAGMTFATGQVRQAASFDGVDDRVEILNRPTLDNITDAVTVEAWINTRAFGVNQYRGMVVKRSPLTADGCLVGYGFVSSWGDGRDVWFAMHPEGVPSSCGNWVTANTALSLNNWYHVVGTYDSITGRQKIYINGSLRNTRTWTVGTRIRVSTGTPLEIGRNQHSFWSFNGLIDEVRIYNRALSASEVRANFNAGR